MQSGNWTHTFLPQTSRERGQEWCVGKGLPSHKKPRSMSTCLALEERDVLTAQALIPGTLPGVTEGMRTLESDGTACLGLCRTQEAV